MKKFIAVLALVSLGGCNWLWNQEPVCNPKSKDYHDCMNPPPLPPYPASVKFSDGGTDASEAG